MKEAFEELVPILAVATFFLLLIPAVVIAMCKLLSDGQVDDGHYVGLVFMVLAACLVAFLITGNLLSQIESEKRRYR